MSDDAGDLFADHYLSLVRLAVRLVNDQQTAEDVVQDVFAAFAHRRRDDIADPLAYLRRAVVNGCRSSIRRRGIARAFWSRSVTLEATEPADAGALRSVERERMLAAIRRLPARQREVIVLRFYEDLAVADIAAVLGVSAGAISSALNRALSALAQTTKESS